MIETSDAPCDAPWRMDVARFSSTPRCRCPLAWLHRRACGRRRPDLNASFGPSIDRYVCDLALPMASRWSVGWWQSDRRTWLLIVGHGAPVRGGADRSP